MQTPDSLRVHRSHWPRTEYRLAGDIQSLLSERTYITHHDHKHYIWVTTHIPLQWRIRMFRGRPLYTKYTITQIHFEYRWWDDHTSIHHTSIHHMLLEAGIPNVLSTEYDGLVCYCTVRLDLLPGPPLPNLLHLLDLYDQWAVPAAGPLV